MNVYDVLLVIAGALLYLVYRGWRALLGFIIERKNHER